MRYHRRLDSTAPMRLLLVTLLLAGCASSVDLRVPAYEGTPVAGRLLVVTAGPVQPTAEALAASGFADAQAFQDSTLDALQRSLAHAYRFTDVQTAPLGASVPVERLYVSRQVVNGGRGENRWTRQNRYLPATAFEGVLAEYVLVLDTVYVDRGMGMDMGGGSRLNGREIVAGTALGVVSGVLTGVSVVPTSKLVRGDYVRARFALYRVGSDVPIIVDEMTGFGGGTDGSGSESAWQRGLDHFTDSLAKTGRIARR